MTLTTRFDRELDSRRERFLETLFRLLRQPSISTQGVGIAECAELVRSVLEENGIAARVMPTEGLPLVYGERRVGAAAGTILFYGHYDVQPPEPYEAWISPPFEPTLRDGRIYARGAGDNKGQFLAHILAVKLLSDLGELPRVNLKFLIEGEEETSSPNLGPFIHGNLDLLRADLVYNADGPAHPSGRPAMNFGHRGNLKMELEARGANRDVHSGNFGGPVPNPIWKLVDLLSTMRFPDGRVAIEGFYDRVVPPTDAEREAMARIPFDEQAVKADLGLEEFAGPRELSYYEKLMFQPTLNVTGIAGGYSGKGARSAIPSTAVAKLEVRTVVDQDPDEVYAGIQRHVRRYAPDARIRKLAATRPSKTAVDLPVSRLVIQAVADAYGVEPVIKPTSGGSNPEHLFTTVLGAPTISVAYGPHDENNHAPNENITLESFFAGIRASALVIRRFITLI